MKNLINFLLISACISSSLNSFSQKLKSDDIRLMVDENFITSTTNLHHFLRLPNDGNFPEQIENNKAWCDSVFKSLKFKTQTLITEGAPLLFAEKTFHKNRKSILFYLQIDGQPVDRSEWSQNDPFEPVFKTLKNGEWTTEEFDFYHKNMPNDVRIFARSASDSKGPAMSLISALKILEEQQITPEYNIKVIMDFQEELGSPDLPKAVLKNKNLLQSEMLLIMDGTRHLSNLPTLTYGARGITTATITIFGSTDALHSGQYGNYAPNPVFKAAQLISSFKNDKGIVQISGFYDGVHLSERDKELLSSIPENMDSLNSRLGIATSEKVAENYQEALQFPSFNIRGLKAGWTGKEVRTLIPEEVIIEIDMRLVPETPGERQIELLRTHIKEEGFHMVDSIPTKEERATYPKLVSLNWRIGSKPFRTEMDSSIGEFLNSALTKVFGNTVVNMRTTGGSQPMAPFIEALDIPAVSIRIPNPDNNIHAPNENLRMGNYKEGIISCIAVLTEKLP